MPDLRPAYVFGPWVLPSDRPDFAYRSAPREDDRAEVWLYRPDDGTPPYWCGSWGGMADAVELRDATSMGAAQRALDAMIGQAGHFLAGSITVSDSLGRLSANGDTRIPTSLMREFGLNTGDFLYFIRRNNVICALTAEQMQDAMGGGSDHSPGVPVDTLARPLNPEDEALVDDMAARRMAGWTTRAIATTHLPLARLSFWIAYGGGFMVGSAIGAPIWKAALLLLFSVIFYESALWGIRRVWAWVRARNVAKAGL